MASRSASRTVCLTIWVPAGTSGSATRATRFGRALVSAVDGFFSPMSASAADLRMLPPCFGWVCASRCAACCAPAPSRADLSSPSPKSSAIGSLSFTPSVAAWTSSLPLAPSLRTAPVESGLVLALAQEQRERLVDLHALGAGLDENLAQGALVARLHLHGG